MQRVVAYGLLLVVWVGCTQSPAPSEKQIAAYVAALEELRRSNLEESAVSAYRAVSGPRYRGDRILHNALQEAVIPRYSEFYRRLQAIPIRNRQLSNLHHVFCEGARYQLLGYRNTLEYLIRQEPALKAEAFSQLEHARRLINRFKREFRRLRQD